MPTDCCTKGYDQEKPYASRNNEFEHQVSRLHGYLPMVSSGCFKRRRTRMHPSGGTSQPLQVPS